MTEGYREIAKYLPQEIGKTRPIDVQEETPEGIRALLHTLCICPGPYVIDYQICGVKDSLLPEQFRSVQDNPEERELFCYEKADELLCAENGVVSVRRISEEPTPASS